MSTPKHKHLTYENRYDAAIAHSEYEITLRKERSHLKITKEQVAAINDVIAPLMIEKHPTDI